ncbi:hypothetical protein CXG50_27620 [Pseudomonas plecoglossicida]|uniref:Uncharacterized protein n=1 Tax=Pseudomonas plecoglossicida TaxID=70775 RepID=A0ABX4TY44_PSEDL|nr:hypothetical protein CSW00_13855 [Pseudomonas sp. MR 02]PLP87995.1 hypothetical protein CX682_22750 [Pseudomonas sp. FFUP_PS_41]PLU84107.1 hypothetical protein CXG44_27965 [Pseudomonas plecoglossicida]TXI08005.1 MAG: hypothetical protein E6Q70_03730 [Pseudomonas monteilii]PLU90002.1 hypothetical protein CXG45_25035 [Pseudomonas plecoglossicida]
MLHRFGWQQNPCGGETIISRSGIMHSGFWPPRGQARSKSTTPSRGNGFSREESNAVPGTGCAGVRG